MGVLLVIAMLTYMKETEVARFLVQIDGTEGCSRVESVKEAIRDIYARRGQAIPDDAQIVLVNDTSMTSCASGKLQEDARARRRLHHAGRLRNKAQRQKLTDRVPRRTRLRRASRPSAPTGRPLARCAPASLPKSLRETCNYDFVGVVRVCRGRGGGLRVQRGRDARRLPPHTAPEHVERQDRRTGATRRTATASSPRATSPAS